MTDTTRAKEQGEEVLKTAVDRFLAWSLPVTFRPDCGISFDGRGKDAMGYTRTWPTGTNLFTADEARAMFEHCLRIAEYKVPPGTERVAAMTARAGNFEAARTIRARPGEDQYVPERASIAPSDERLDLLVTSLKITGDFEPAEAITILRAQVAESERTKELAEQSNADFYNSLTRCSSDLAACEAERDGLRIDVLALSRVMVAADKLRVAIRGAAGNRAGIDKDAYDFARSAIREPTAYGCQRAVLGFHRCARWCREPICVASFTPIDTALAQPEPAP